MCVLGGILRDHLEHFLCIFSCPIGIDAYNATEFKEIAKALELLCSTSFHPHIGSHFLVESYSIAAISLAQNLDSSPWHLSGKLQCFFIIFVA